MALPDVWVEKTELRVAALLADYPSLANLGNAFAVWALMQLHGLTEEEALEATARRLDGPGDAGIDAVVSDDLLQVLYLCQMKYSTGLNGNFDESAAQELFAGLDLLMSESYSREAGSRFLDAREQLLGTLSGGSDVILQVVVAGRLSDQAEARIRAYVEALNNSQIRVEMVDADALWRLHRDESEGLDLSGERVTLVTVGQPLTVPSSASGLAQAQVVVVDAASLVPAVGDYGRRLVANNLRHLLKSSRINDAIAKSTTAQDLRSRFALLNNGLTVTCEELAAVKDGIELLNPQIVNGGQTTMTLYENRHNFNRGEIYLIARIVATTPGEDGRKLALEIAEATNRQNPITPADLKANDDKQKHIQAALAAVEPPWFYERRRNERASLGPGRLGTYVGVITKEDLGQRWRAFTGQPAVAITGKQAMFVQQDLYGELYSTDIDVRLYVLAHQLFELYYDLLGASNAMVNLRQQLIPALTEVERSELVRARNQWAAHCTALTAHLLREAYGDISPYLASRLTSDVRGGIRSASGDFVGLIRLVALSVHKWFKDKKIAAQENDTILAVKAEFEKSQTLTGIVSEAETYQAFVSSLPEYALPEL